jgi:hypothetical protein
MRAVSNLGLMYSMRSKNLSSSGWRGEGRGDKMRGRVEGEGRRVKER